MLNIFASSENLSLSYRKFSFILTVVSTFNDCLTCALLLSTAIQGRIGSAIWVGSGRVRGRCLEESDRDCDLVLMNVVKSWRKAV